MGSSIIKVQSSINHVASLDLDNARDGIFVVDGSNILGTKPYDLATGMFHTIYMYKRSNLEQEIIFDCYAAKISMRTRRYNGGLWTWSGWASIQLSYL